jgi:hypothetical protein
VSLKLRLAIPRRTLIVGAVILLWTGLLLGGAIPAWRASLRRGDELIATEEQLAQLNLWAVTGLWLERSLAEREPALLARYTRLIPARRDKERLFLDLARVADSSGVMAFDLKEEERSGSWLAQDPDAMMEGGATDAMPATDDMMDDGAGTDRPLPRVPVQQYRVRATFTGDFARVARFLTELQKIPRALSLHRLAARSAPQGIEVELELDFYVDESL